MKRGHYKPGQEDCNVSLYNLQKLQTATVGSKGPNGKKGDSSKDKPPDTRTPCMFNDQSFMCSRRFL
eukprot:jgi/Chrzof1/14348/UNPLg00622.t1